MQPSHSPPADGILRSAFFLVGPTATGKSGVAHYLAEREGSWILSADSMLIYRGMDIGTDKPTVSERSRVRYWGVDVIEPQQSFSVGLFMEHAGQAFGEAERAGKRMVVAGGTGLYVKCLTEGLDRAPSADADMRRQAEQVLETQGLPGLQDWVRRVDPEAFELLRDKANPRRLIRVLERALHPDRAEPTSAGRPDVPLVGLRMDAVALNARIAARVARMYEEGLLEEVRGLRDRVPELSATARHAIGYAEALGVLGGELTRKEAMERTVIRTRQLAKRQMTWFRHQARVEWIEVDAREAVGQIAERVLALWRKHGATPVNVTS
jgi:tRNA dimethylallyltransferase